MKLLEQLKPALWGAAAGAVVMMIAGFSFMGWKTGSAAEDMARTQASAAVVAAMVPFCVAKAKNDPDTGPMAKFRAETSPYSRTQIVSAAGWATLAGATSADYSVASACSDRLQAAAN